MPTGLAFILSGWVVGVVCLFVAGGLSLVLWTPLGRWLGVHTYADPNNDESTKAQGHPGRIYGGAAIGAVLREREAQQQDEANFIAVEAEIALAYEEASALAKLLWGEWPYITPLGSDLEEAIFDWRLKTTSFIGAILGPGYRAQFKTLSGNDVLDRIESEGKFLGELAIDLTPDLVRAGEAEILKAREERRENKSSNFIEVEHYRAPGAPPKTPAQEAREFGRRDDAGELAKRCHVLAGSVERWAQRFTDQESTTVEQMVDEWAEANPSVERAEARRKAYTRNEKNWELDYVLRFGAEARTLFAEAFAMGEIAKEHERLATRPLAIEFEQVPRLFNEVAEGLYAATESTALARGAAETPR